MAGIVGPRFLRAAALLLLGSLTAAAINSGDRLLDAARSDDAGSVARLIREGADVNAREPDGATALSWAAMRSNVAAAELLLKAGANPNLTNDIGISPLSVSVANGCPALVALLLKKGADPNIAREDGETPLMIAARLGQTDVVKVLLESGAKPNTRTKKFGQTALMWAAGHPEIVDLLLKNGADARAITNSWDVKYIVYAPTTVTLGKTGIPWNTDGEYMSKKGGQSPLFFAVQKHDLESARQLLDAGLDVNQPSADGTTPLLAALYHWDPPSTTFIPGKGAPAQAGTSQALHGDLVMAKFLLQRGAKAKAVDGAGYTPLHGAVLAAANAALGPDFRKGGGYGANPALLSLGPEKNRPPAETLDQALEIVKTLLEAGADPNQQTVYPTPGPAGDVRINPAPPGSSAFHIAAASTSVALVKLLADKGADPNLLRKDGYTPFSVSVMARNLDVVREMVARGADLNLRYNPAHKIPDPEKAISLTRQAQTIMHIAALGGSLPVMEYLQSQGVRLDLKNSIGETPLDLADAQERYREAIERERADGDPEKLRAVVRKTETTDGIRKLMGMPARRAGKEESADPQGVRNDE
jgi:ankyrin repeat protein